jgi:hypothetical protein
MLSAREVLTLQVKSWLGSCYIISQGGTVLTLQVKPWLGLCYIISQGDTDSAVLPNAIYRKFVGS